MGDQSQVTGYTGQYPQLAGVDLSAFTASSYPQASAPPFPGELSVTPPCNPYAPPTTEPCGVPSYTVEEPDEGDKKEEQESVQESWSVTQIFQRLYKPSKPQGPKGKKCAALAARVGDLQQEVVQWRERTQQETTRASSNYNHYEYWRRKAEEAEELARSTQQMLCGEQRKVQTLRARVMQLGTSNQSLGELGRDAVIKTKDDEIADWKKRYAKYVQEMAELGTELDGLQQAKRDFARANKQLTKGRQFDAKKLRELQDQVAALTAERERYVEENARLTNALGDHTKRESSLAAKIAALMKFYKAQFTTKSEQIDACATEMPKRPKAKEEKKKE